MDRKPNKTSFQWPANAPVIKRPARKILLLLLVSFVVALATGLYLYKGIVHTPADDVSPVVEDKTVPMVGVPTIPERLAKLDTLVSATLEDVPLQKRYEVLLTISASETDN